MLDGSGSNEKCHKERTLIAYFVRRRDEPSPKIFKISLKALVHHRVDQSRRSKTYRLSRGFPRSRPMFIEAAAF
jgi:hypothetical protein